MLLAGVVAAARRLAVDPLHRRLLRDADAGLRPVPLHGGLQVAQPDRRLRRHRGRAEDGAVLGRAQPRLAAGVLLPGRRLRRALAALCRALVRSPFGRALQAIRENERRFTSLGRDPRPFKLVVFVIAAVFAGLAGALFAPFRGFASPEVMFWVFSGQALMMVTMGGIGTLVGPIVGAMVFILIQEILSSYTEHWMIFTGVVFVLIVIFLPGGLVGTARRLRRARVTAPMLETRGLGRAFGALQAVAGVELRGAARRAARGHRTERRRQDHAVPPDLGAAGADRGPRALPRRRRHRARRARALPARHLAHVPDHQHLPRAVRAGEHADGRAAQGRGQLPPGRRPRGPRRQRAAGARQPRVPRPLRPRRRAGVDAAARRSAPARDRDGRRPGAGAAAARRAHPGPLAGRHGRHRRRHPPGRARAEADDHPRRARHGRGLRPRRPDQRAPLRPAHRRGHAGRDPRQRRRADGLPGGLD